MHPRCGWQAAHTGGSIIIQYNIVNSCTTMTVITLSFWPGRIRFQWPLRLWEYTTLWCIYLWLGEDFYPILACTSAYATDFLHWRALAWSHSMKIPLAQQVSTQTMFSYNTSTDVPNFTCLEKYLQGYHDLSLSPPFVYVLVPKCNNIKCTHPCHPLSAKILADCLTIVSFAVHLFCPETNRQPWCYPDRLCNF